MVVDEEGAFDHAWVEYAKRHINPDTGKLFADDAEARAFAKAKGLRAFQDGDRSKVHIRKERANLGTQLHEGLHLHASEQWNKEMGAYSATRASRSSSRARSDRRSDRARHQLVPAGVPRRRATFAKAAGEDVLAAAYFEGDIEGLKRKIDTRGSGTWKKWLDFLMDNNFKAANALLM